jgi:hypothetical protein
MGGSGDLKRCSKCREEKPRAQFSRDRSRPDGRYPQCKSCVRRWQQGNAEHLADYHRAGSRRTGTSSALRTAATGSASARTLSIESDGEPTPAAAIESSEPKTPPTWSAAEPTTAATGSESEPEFPTPLAGQTTAHRHRRLMAPCPAGTSKDVPPSPPTTRGLPSLPLWGSFLHALRSRCRSPQSGPRARHRTDCGLRPVVLPRRPVWLGMGDYSAQIGYKFRAGLARVELLRSVGLTRCRARRPYFRPFLAVNFLTSVPSSRSDGANATLYAVV